MDIVILKGVQAHELRNLFQGLQFSMEPQAILVEPVNPEPPKLLPAPAGGAEKCGAQSAECGISTAKDAKGREGDRGHDGRDDLRPLHVNVVVNNAPVISEQSAVSSGGKAEARGEVSSEQSAVNSRVKSSLEAIHADVRTIKEVVPAAISRVEKGVETVQQHVRGVPILQAELAEARVVPENLALEIQNRIADILTTSDQEIWRAVRNAGGSQKNALPALRASGCAMSAATLSRRVQGINTKLRQNGLPVCDAPGTAVRFKKSGGHETDEGKGAPEELSPVETDWADDPADRETTIRAFLGASAADREYFLQTKPGIEEEARKYLKRARVKSGRD